MWRLRLIVVAGGGARRPLRSRPAAATARRRPRSSSRPRRRRQASLGKTEFIAQADSICAEANTSIEQFAAAGQGVTEAAQIAQLRQGVIDTSSSSTRPPTPNLDEFLRRCEARSPPARRSASPLQRGRTRRSSRPSSTTAKSEAATAASAYGFKECGAEINRPVEHQLGTQRLQLELGRQQRSRPAPRAHPAPHPPPRARHRRRRRRPGGTARHGQAPAASGHRRRQPRRGGDLAAG